MIEVTIRIRFLRECLGSVKRKRGKTAIFSMPRAPDGRVMFLPTWWQIAIRDAAKIANRHQELVRRIDWDPVVDGEPRSNWRRPVPGAGQRIWHAIHEAFGPGDEIGVNAVLPDGIDIEDFWRLLDIAGTYRGISPFKPHERYGTFQVVSIQRRRRSWAEDGKSTQVERVEEPKEEKVNPPA